jgi:hypothetical protein
MKIGDVVCIKSDVRYPMTVVSIDDDFATCVWWSAHGDIKSRAYPINALKRCNALKPLPPPMTLGDLVLAAHKRLPANSAKSENG